MMTLKYLHGDTMPNRIKEIMQKQKITQIDLARMTGINQAELSRIINEKKTVTLPTARKISKALGWGIDHIWPD